MEKSVFPAHPNTGRPNGPVEAWPLIRSLARDIHDGPEHNRSKQRPDTLMQDR
jgi:hypothetical protein